MAGITISGLATLEFPADDDFLIIVDRDAKATKKTTISAIKTQLVSLGSDYYLKTETLSQSEIELTLALSPNWDSAYSWGNHSLLGYELSSNKGIANGYAELDINGDIPLNRLSFALKTTHPVSGVTTNDISNWDSAYSWGNHSLLGYELSSNKGIANGYCPLGSDLKISSAFLPAIAITSTKVVADVGEMELWAEAEEGDVAIVGNATDGYQSYIKTDTIWIKLDASGWVTSVNAATGTVVLSASDVGALDILHDAKDVTTAKITNWDYVAVGGAGHHSTLGYAFSNSLASVALSGSYGDLSSVPSNVTALVDGFMSSVDKVILDALASTTYFDGSYTNLTNVPTSFPPATHIHDLATTTVSGFMAFGDKTKLDGIATSANVNVNSDWNSTTGDSQILNKPTLFSGSYADLSNIPSNLLSIGSELNNQAINTYEYFEDAVAALPTNSIMCGVEITLAGASASGKYYNVQYRVVS